VPDSTDPVLELRDISVKLSGLQILDRVSISVPRGHVVGVIGPNGAGKTTAFNVISGLVKPDSGDVVLDGRVLRRIKPNRLAALGVARTLQGVGLFPTMTALENVMLGGSSSVTAGIVADSLAMPWADGQQSRVQAQALQMLADFGISDAASRLPSELPYPVQKRVALARALMCDPLLVLLDEPAGGVGSGDMADLKRIIREWVPRRTVLLVEHHMELVMSVCDLIWVMDAGRIIASGTPDEVRSDPAVLAAYLGEEGVA
jgi:branched-chain amino acid transport system ATP-binding protein